MSAAMLSEENRRRAEQGLSLIIDEQWIKVFPGDRPYRGESVVVKMKLSKKTHDSNKFISCK